jgi:hypothetical protein
MSMYNSLLKIQRVQTTEPRLGTEPILVAPTTDSGIRLGRDDGAADSFIHGMRRRFTIDVYSPLLENQRSQLQCFKPRLTSAHEANIVIKSLG